MTFNWFTLMCSFVNICHEQLILDHVGFRQRRVRSGDQIGSFRQNGNDKQWANAELADMVRLPIGCDAI
jgi:hypothetical protein